MNKIPVIDLFAGPGGLGEGFSSLTDEKGNMIFDIKLSIEKDIHAHQTLLLRSFFRKLKKNGVPEIYYKYIKENRIKIKQELLKKLQQEYRNEWEKAQYEAWHFELPYPEEFDKEGLKKGGYKPLEIEQRNKEIDKRIKSVLPKKKDFLLIGGPPCQAYSLVGRSRNQGISIDDHRVHLYKEYLRIIAVHHPAVFVMENVKGLLSAEIKGEKVFNLIKEDLRNPEKAFNNLTSPRYKVYSLIKEPDEFDEEGFPVYKNDQDYLIKAEKYGVPQRRHRVILLGIREDIADCFTQVLSPHDREITLKEVIGALPRLRSGISREIIGTNEKGKHVYRKITNNFDNWSNAVISYKDKFDKSIISGFNGTIKTDNTGKNFVKHNLKEGSNPLFNSWYKDIRLDGILNHETRTHLKEDLGRYLFSSLYLKAMGNFPRLKDYPEWLLPKHKNAKKGEKFADRFRTQKPDQAATTVTSHISKDGHYFIHYDPRQCRSLTVREAARIQTFPDNYYFCGSRTHQYHQVGNAVPPFLAKQIAKVVLDIFNSIPKKKNIKINKNLKISEIING